MWRAQACSAGWRDVGCRVVTGLILTASILGVTACLSAGGWFLPWAAAVGVRPLVIDIAAQPGEEKEFELVLSPGATSPERVHLGLYRVAQLPTGELAYQPADSNQDPATGWVELGPADVEVQPGKELQLRGVVKVPLNAGRGTHTIAVMIEPQRPAAAGQIVIRMVYAVRITVDVESDLVRPRLEAELPTLQADDQQRPYVQVAVTNTSTCKFPVTGQVTVRDSQRRLVERVDLSTNAARQAGLDHTPIYPNAQLLLSGPIRSPLPPGTYELRVFLQYAEGLQLIRTAKVSVGPGQFVSPSVSAKSSGGVVIEPAQIDVPLRAGAMSVQVISLQNDSDQPVHLVAVWREIDPAYDRSLLRQLTVALRGPTELDLPARRPGRFIVSLQAPRNLPPGGYYAWLDIAEVAAGKVVQVHSQLVSAMIAGDWTARAQILDLQNVTEPDGELISVSVRNDSPVAIRPAGTLTLGVGVGVGVQAGGQAGTSQAPDQAQAKTQAQVTLALPPDSPAILPGRTGLLFAKVPMLSPGTYQAHIVVELQGKALATTDKSFVVAEPPAVPTP